MLSRRFDSRDAGTTLVELLVGMVLMSIVGTIALNFFIGTTAQASRVGEQSLAGANARAVMSQIVQTLALADTPTASPGYSTNRFVTVQPGEVTFYSDTQSSSRSGSGVRSAPVEIDYTLTNGVLWESTYQPQGTTAPATYPSSPTSRTAIVTGLTNSIVFRYCSAATDPSITCTATTNPASVAMVQVTLTVQGRRGSAPQTVQSGTAIGGQLS